MGNNLEFMRELIFENYINKNYTEVINLGKKYLKRVQKVKRKITNLTRIEFNEAMWYGYYYIANAFKKKGNLKRAIKSIKLSIKYSIQMTNDNQNKMLKENSCLNDSRWFLASCYRLVNKSNKSVQIYKRISKFYKFIEMDSNRVEAVFSIASTLKNTNGMLRVIDIFEKTEDDLIDIDKPLMLKDMYRDVINICMEKNQIDKIFRLLHRIDDTKFKRELISVVSIHYLNVA